MDHKVLEGNYHKDEPSTPVTRISIQPNHNHVIHCVIGFKNPIDVATLKDELSNSIMLKIPRFTSLLVVDPHHRTEYYWKKTHVNLDDHITIIHDHGYDHDHDHAHAIMSDEDIINSYLADIAISSPMSLDKPLWEIIIMHEQKCMILRVHHAVADGMSLMSMLWTMGRSSSLTRGVHDNNKNDHDAFIRGRLRSLNNMMGLWEGLKYIWFSLVLLLKYVARCFNWVKDKGNAINGIEGVELWPRKVATAKFQLNDMKSIKKVIPNAKINDVLCGILWCGLTRYFNIQHPRAVQDGVQITGLCLINLRKRGGVQDVNSLLSGPKTAWGNRFQMVLLPITYFKRGMDALTYTSLAKAVMDRKKRSMEARLCNFVGSLVLGCFGSKVGGHLIYNLFSNTSFFMSNIAGPQEVISIAGNLVTFIRATSSSQPHAITMHMVSYARKADLQIQVAKDVIPDPEFLAKCFEDALLEMKEAADNCVATEI